MSRCPAGRCDNPLAASLPRPGLGPNADGFEGIGQDARSLESQTDPPVAADFEWSAFSRRSLPRIANHSQRSCAGKRRPADIVKPDPSKTRHGAAMTFGSATLEPASATPTCPEPRSPAAQGSQAACPDFFPQRRSILKGPRAHRNAMQSSRCLNWPASIRAEAAV